MNGKCDDGDDDDDVPGQEGAQGEDRELRRVLRREINSSLSVNAL